ncbi:hypothetical protein [Streptococcus oralis]|uniref:hypothetical protein n=1 Tax=Streptococcus oralis TaxID=1303 RepID=UPI00228450A4|nr:hypothetical protein [Streptococcus oralis]MCY7079207.1 hypothetical protein [Streptococcus oralis]
MILNLSVNDFSVFLLASDESYDYFCKELSYFFEITISLENIKSNQRSWMIVTEKEWLQNNSCRDKFEIVYEETRTSEPIRKFAVNRESKVIVIEEPSEDIWRQHIAIRLVRDMYRIHVIQNKGVPLHGGMIERNGFGIAVLGRKKSGKTTTLLSMMDEDANFIANDDLIVSYEYDIKGHGSTRSISIRKDTIPYIRNNYLDRIASNPLNKTELKKKYLFLKPVELFNNNVKIKATICLFIFPKFNSDIESPRVYTLSTEQLFLELKNNIEDTRYSYFPNVLNLIFPDNDLSDIYSDILKKIVNSNKVKGIKVEQNIGSMINIESLLLEGII